MNPLNYVRAALSFRSGLATGATIPRIETKIPPQTVSERTLAELCHLTNYPSNGYLPITFPYIYGFSTHLRNMLDPRFPFSLMGTVHVRSAIHQIKPIGSGSRIAATCWIEGHREVDKGTEFDLCTDVTVGDECVWRGIATMLRRRARGDQDRALPLNAVRPPLDGVGARSAEWRLPRGLSRQFALATGDINPIHLTGLTARVFGFKGAIVHGSWIEMRLAGTNPELCRSPNVEFQCEFKQPVTLPATVIFRQWPCLKNTDHVELRLLNKSADKPHAIATIGPKEITK
ncbi:MAG: hypothetical protein RL011_709 [Pseudomonadota bacterium]|jgi:hypothetical protein